MIRFGAAETACCSTASCRAATTCILASRLRCPSNQDFLKLAVLVDDPDLCAVDRHVPRIAPRTTSTCAMLECDINLFRVIASERSTYSHWVAILIWYFPGVLFRRTATTHILDRREEMTNRLLHARLLNLCMMLLLVSSKSVEHLHRISQTARTHTMHTETDSGEEY